MGRDELLKSAHVMAHLSVPPVCSDCATKVKTRQISGKGAL